MFWSIFLSLEISNSNRAHTIDNKVKNSLWKTSSVSNLFFQFSYYRLSFSKSLSIEILIRIRVRIEIILDSSKNVTELN